MKFEFFPDKDQDDPWLPKRPSLYLNQPQASLQYSRGVPDPNEYRYVA